MPAFRLIALLSAFVCCFISAFASAADYTWWYNFNVGPYKSAIESCAANGWSGFDPYYGPADGFCTRPRTEPDGTTSTQYGPETVRRGESCPSNTTYNTSTGGCDSAGPTYADGQVCDDQSGSKGPDDPMIYSAKSGKCVLFSESDDPATCAYLGSKSGPGSAYTVAGNWDGGVPSAPPVFAQDGLSCEVSTISTTDCVAKGVSGAVECNVVGKYSGKVSNKTNVVDAKDAACLDNKCEPIPASTKTTNDPCVYSGSGDSVSCVSDSNTSKDGTQKCGTVNGVMTCLTVPPSSNGIKIASTVKTTSDADGGKTAVKTDTATKTTCTGINKCTTSTSTTTTTTKTNSAGQTTGTKTDCKGTCGSSGTGIGSGTPSGNGTGDQSSGNCTSEDCGSGGAGGLHDPDNGNFDGQSADWDKKIEDGKKDLKDRIDKMKTAFDPLSQAGLGGGGGQLFCPPAVEFYGRSITFCLDQFASSLSWIAAAVYASCALTALFIIFL